MTELDPDQLKPVGSPSTFADAVAYELRKAIARQGLGRGDTLPSEHRLALALAVSRPVIRQALERLEDEGLITRRAGKVSELK